MSDASATPGFTRIDNRVITGYAPRIGAHALAVYVVLALHADNTTRRCYPSTRTIARLVHLSQPTVLKALATLEEVGLIKVERPPSKHDRRRVNIYTLSAPGGDQPALAPVLNDVEHGAKGALAELDSINKTQKNQRAATSTDRAPARPASEPRPPAAPDAALAPGRDPNLAHPAVRAYRGECKLTPNQAQRAAIAETVTDLARWQEVLRKWLLAGYRPSNVDGLLDWYTNGIPERRGNHGIPGTRGRLGFGGGWSGEPRDRQPSDTPDDLARRDAEWQKLVHESETRS
jgi:DNA-binding PadR family transcriptional regulator